LLWSLGLVGVLSLLPGYIGGHFAAKAAGVDAAFAPEWLLDSPEFARAMIPWIGFGQVCSLLVGVVAIRWTMGRSFARQIGLGRPSFHHLVVAVVALPAIIVVAAAVDGLLKLVLPRVFDVEGSVRMMASWPWYWGVLLVGVAPGIGEELWFRGFFGRELIARYGVLAGVLLTSLLFGLVHLDPRHAVTALTMGIFLHLVYLATGSLWVPVLLHVVNNTASILALGHDGPTLLSITAEEIPWTVYGASVMLLGAAGWALFRTRVRSIDDLPPRHGDFPSQTTTRLRVAAWLAPTAAACFFAGVSVPAGMAYQRRMAPFYVEVPAAVEVGYLLQTEPISAETWPTWSRRLREWLPDRSGRSERAFAAARKFLEYEFASGAPRPPMATDSTAWFLHGAGLLQQPNPSSPGPALGAEAEPFLRRSIEFDPQFGRAHHMLAVAIYLQVLTDGSADAPGTALARREAEIGEQLDPTAYADGAEAFAALMLGKYEAAATLYARLAEDHPYDKLLRNRARLAVDLGSARGRR